MQVEVPFEGRLGGEAVEVGSPGGGYVRCDEGEEGGWAREVSVGYCDAEAGYFFDLGDGGRKGWLGGG